MIADPDKDEFSCDKCGGVFDIEDSIEIECELCCPNCANKIKQED